MKVVYVENPVNVELAKAVLDAMQDHTVHIETLIRGLISKNILEWERAEAQAAKLPIERERTERARLAAERVADLAPKTATQAEAEWAAEPKMPSDLS